MFRSILALCFCAVAFEAAAAEEISLSDVPANVMARAEETAPGVTFTRVTVETENGARIYEFEAVGPDGRHIEVDVTDQAVLEEIEMEIAEDDMPRDVARALERRFPGMSVESVEESVRAGGVFIYEIEGVTAAGASVSVEIAESGEIVSVSDRAFS